jgi:hypothetical protein
MRLVACVAGRRRFSTMPESRPPPAPSGLSLNVGSQSRHGQAAAAHARPLARRLLVPGAAQVGGEFLARFYPGPKLVLIPAPSWANHKAIFERCGMTVQQYRCEYAAVQVQYDDLWRSALEHAACSAPGCVPCARLLYYWPASAQNKSWWHAELACC